MQAKSHSRVPVMLLAAAMLLVAMFGLTGCWSDVDITIGTESDDSVEMIFYNSTGKDIVEVSVSAAGDDATEPESLVFDDDAWEYGMKSRIYCGPSDISDSGCDIELVYDDGETGTLHGVMFDESDTVVVSIDDDSGVTYLSYNDENDETIYTLDAEKELDAAQ